MNNNGWIKLHRRIQKKAFYRKPYYLALWTHLLLSANHSGTEFMWNGAVIAVSSGQFITGRKQLSEDTGIPETSVERILSFFEKERQIGQQKTTKYRLITIRKWNEYQIVDNRRTTDGQQTDTNKNDKKEKNISETKVSGIIGNNSNNVAWKKNQGDEPDIPDIDIDSQKEIENDESKVERETKELNVKIRANLKTIEPLRGIPWGTGKDMNFHVKIYRELLKAGHSHTSIISTFMELVETPHWKEKKKQGEYAGMNTVQFYLRNKKSS